MNPKVSILITAYQRLDYIKNLVHSIRQGTNWDKYEIIIATT